MGVGILTADMAPPLGADTGFYNDWTFLVEAIIGFGIPIAYVAGLKGKPWSGLYTTPVYVLAAHMAGEALETIYNSLTVGSVRRVSAVPVSVNRSVPQRSVPASAGAVVF
jgi:hypothetical protein